MRECGRQHNVDISRASRRFQASMHAYPAVMRHVPQCRAARERAVAHPSGGNASLDAALAIWAGVAALSPSRSASTIKTLSLMTRCTSRGVVRRSATPDETGAKWSFATPRSSVPGGEDHPS